MSTEQEKLKIFQYVHMKPVGGHLGMNKTYENEIIYCLASNETRNRRLYKKCEISQKNKITQHKVKIPLQINTTPGVVWGKCCMDIVGPLTVTTEGHK